MKEDFVNQQQNSDESWEDLEEQYFLECLEDGGGGIFTYKLSPIKLLEWFKSKIAKRYEAQQEADAQLEDDDFEEDHDQTCSACGRNYDNHMAGCPEDDSPYALLLRRGFD